MHAAQTTDEQASSLKALSCNKVLAGKLEAGCLCIKSHLPDTAVGSLRSSPASMWGENAESRVLTQDERKKEGITRHQG
ncbi:hypothetical protein BCON_0119g00060 [Botryotinia convoluta]|uniref:Uncharacterized protein n=1 Tax=Botryotinia convoluta TaxID=54673 RepID=A0A4Z1IA01_9HELO|nr:hypothetical protein BCON_0119g00060 [Botryotinia convoluta]